MANYNYITQTGVITPDTSALLAEVQDEFKVAFGADLIVTPDTPQGVLITGESLARAGVVANNTALANQINPDRAGGVFLDALLGLTGMQRTAQTKTFVAGVALTGVPGSIIPEQSQAKTSDGDIFETSAQVTLDSDGNATVDFYSQDYGPIACAANALNTIVSGVIGWETVDNPDAGTLGATTQSDQAARALRKNTLAFNGISLAEAITSALYATDGVTSLTFQENVSAITQTINGISMVSHSVYACVDGGTNTDVAAALLENKSSGAAWNGGTTVTVIEPASGQAYAVKFDRPSEIGILIRVTTSNGNADNISDALLEYASGGQEGESGFVVGADVSPYELAGAIARRYPQYYVSNIEISLVDPIDYQVTPIAIGVNQIALTQESYITVVVA